MIEPLIIGVSTIVGIFGLSVIVVKVMRYYDNKRKPKKSPPKENPGAVLRIKD